MRPRHTPPPTLLLPTAAALLIGLSPVLKHHHSQVSPSARPMPQHTSNTTHSSSSTNIRNDSSNQWLKGRSDKCSCRTALPGPALRLWGVRCPFKDQAGPRCPQHDVFEMPFHTAAYSTRTVHATHQAHCRIHFSAHYTSSDPLSSTASF